MISGGRVVIKDNVDIGALCTIDKGVTGDTTIGEGTKIDNQVHVGHDTVIGKKCLIAAQTGIAGCVVIEDEVTLWGQVGTTSGITIGSKAIVMGQTGITKSIEGSKAYFGTPIEESREKLKQLANIKTYSRNFKKNYKMTNVEIIKDFYASDNYRDFAFVDKLMDDSILLEWNSSIGHVLYTIRQML